MLVAAGSGERLAAGLPKALVPLAGVPLLVHAVRALGDAELVDGVVVVAPAADCGRVDEVLRVAGLTALAICAGGGTRQESVALGLAACPRGTRVVAVHDAARPLVSPALVDRTIAALVDPWAAVAPGLPVVDTLKVVDAARERVVSTADRRNLWAVQTPQVFAHATLTRVHARIAAGEVTDDLVLVETAGGRVRVIPGERRNFKVTYPEDLAMAEALLAAGGAPRPG